MRQFHTQENRPEVGTHYKVPFFDAGLNQRFGDLVGGIIYESIQAVGELPGFLKDQFQLDNLFAVQVFAQVLF